MSERTEKPCRIAADRLEIVVAVKVRASRSANVTREQPRQETDDRHELIAELLRLRAGTAQIAAAARCTSAAAASAHSTNLIEHPELVADRILLENYYLPGDLEARIGRFVDHYNHRRSHESLSNRPLPPA
jgi:hypothetical protein